MNTFAITLSSQFTEPYLVRLPGIPFACLRRVFFGWVINRAEKSNRMSRGSMTLKDAADYAMDICSGRRERIEKNRTQRREIIVAYPKTKIKKTKNKIIMPKRRV